MELKWALLALSLQWTFAWAQADPAEAQTQTERLLLVTSVLPGEAVLAELDRFANDSSLDLETRELALRSLVLALRENFPDTVSWRAVEALTSYRERALTRHSESLSYGEPLYHIAAPAQGTLNLWIRIMTRQAAESALAESRIEFFASLAAGHVQEIAGAADALRESPSDWVQPAAETLLKSAGKESRLFPLALAAAESLQDEDFLLSLLDLAPSELRLRLILSLDQYIGEKNALAWWQTALLTDQNKAAAITALGPRIAENPQILELLLTELGDEQFGVAAAHAIGRSQTPNSVEPLAAMLNDPSPLVAARAILALEVNGSDAAKAAVEAKP